MDIKDVIKSIDKDILFRENEISKLQSKKDKLEKLFTLYPEANINNGAISINNIWDKISCMRIEHKTSYTYSAYNIVVKFFVGKKYLIEGMPVYVNPYENIVAEVHNNWNKPNVKKEIMIFDYKKIVPMECARRNNFIKRIKNHILSTIAYGKLPINHNSFDKDDFNKLLLLK